MSASDFLETKLINHVLGKAAYTMPVNVYVALFTADPGEAGSLVNEVPAGVGYARKLITADMSLSAGGSASTNASVQEFGPDTNADWGTITHAALVDSATIGAGNVLISQALSASRTIKIGDSYRMNAGQISLAFD